jgi:hypothetical protein
MFPLSRASLRQWISPPVAVKLNLRRGGQDAQTVTSATVARARS